MGLRRLLLFVAALPSVGAAAPATIDVDPAAMSLQEAQAAARKARAAGAASVVLRLGSGAHALRGGPLELTAADSNTTWAGAPGATVSGGATLEPEAFSPVPSTDPIAQRLPAAVRGSVLRADVSAHRAAFTLPGPRGRNSAGYRRADGSIDPVPCAPMMELLTSDGEPLTVARWPNAHQEGGGAMHGWAVTGPGSNTSGFVYPASAPPVATSAENVFAAGYWIYDWADATIAVSSLRDGFATVPSTPLYVNESDKGSFPPGSRFFFLNAPEFLDTAGEYWLDQDTGMLYLLPASPGSGSGSGSGSDGWGGAVLSVARGLFEIKPGTVGVTFRSLTMMAAQSVAIKCGSLDYPPTYDCGASDIRIEACTIVGFGTSGVQIDGGHNVSVESSTVRSTGGTAVYLSGGDRSDLTPVSWRFSRACRASR